ncbi:pyridoxamine 5'-phosphate oxidase family protein [Ramlibacter tataouinensis]|uniref:General stress protein-like protein n=1 Tax=Ramlibacter tataouinensis (strain ATCC BAA-407 / DSM 14655 / LMG 21543 / TTB310) TaxID=365046 RepID=F5Y564_RAMTT|nr:pyridoxamine 5'-phosphate oxidase family protein [Ramlibacter tataouinensis]AEG93904.1 general stress protein-like protein [Ramlibacter tataouinensis TTB310]
MSRNDSPHDTLWKLIKDMRFGMLTHRHPDGTLHAHPLTTQNKALDEGVLYFFVSKSTEVGRRLQVDGDVCVAYADASKDHYVSISGHATVSSDRAKVERLFNALAKAWFPGGVDDPNLELVEVKILHAEYWDVKESKVTQLAKMATAAVTGHPPHLGEHQELHFS